MSAKKSFDLEAKRPTKKKVAVRRTKRAEPAPRRKKSLRERREEERTLRNIGLGVAGLLVVCGLLYLLWRPEIRITQVHAVGVEDVTTVESLAKEELQGAYYHVIPRDSFFFYPKQAIEAQILAEYPTIADVRLARQGFSALTIEAVARERAFLWCGTPEERSSLTCFETDKEGLVYAPSYATSTELLRVYAALDVASSTDPYPIRHKIIGAESIRNVLRFAENVRALSVPVRAISLRGDEADLHVGEGTRVTYVIGHEREAADNARAAFSKLNLLDGSIEYVDLRFPGKVYIKRYGEE
ncbi:MAG TPA: hypothetical protein VEB18_03060 [Candidatus Paceibacterota bacterium]|nr:hypothetical protein [Candidatus Paceibacterota bacterium]